MDDSRDVTQADADELATDPATVRAKAIKLLARREHAHAELVSKLTSRGFDHDTSEAVVDDLAAEDLQSESRYAEAMVRDRVRRGKGPMQIRADLNAAGCDREIAEHAIADADVDWTELATSVRAKKFGKAPPGDRHMQAKQTRFLQRRGFDGDAIRAALKD